MSDELDIDIGTGNLVPTGGPVTRSLANSRQAQTGQVSGDMSSQVDPVRSWKRGDKTQGTYDAQFDYEGATIQLQSLSDDAWNVLEEMEEKLTDQSDALQEEQEEQERLAGLSPVDLKSENLTSHDLRQRRRAYNKHSKEVAEALFEFHMKIVQDTVINWKRAPIAYSATAVSELPREMVADWAQIILEKSRLGQSSAKN